MFCEYPSAICVHILTNKNGLLSRTLVCNHIPSRGNASWTFSYFSQCSLKHYFNCPVIIFYGMTMSQCSCPRPFYTHSVITVHFLRTKPCWWYCWWRVSKYTLVLKTYCCQILSQSLARKHTPSACVQECSLPHLGINFPLNLSQNYSSEKVCLF